MKRQRIFQVVSGDRIVFESPSKSDAIQFFDARQDPAARIQKAKAASLDLSAFAVSSGRHQDR
jgi:hypothetical protein